MKTILVASVALAALGSASAFAADIPARAPYYKAPVVAPYDPWTGCYVGAQVGWAGIRDRQDLSSPTFALSVTDSANGIVGGGHLGCNYQVNQIVFGVEGDLEASSIKDSFTIGPPFVNTTGTERLQWQGSVRGRLGIAVNQLLWYGTGGVAFGHFTDTYCTLVAGVCQIGGPGFFDSVSSTRTGWTVGGGLQYAYNNHWSSRIEYRFTNFGNHTNALNNFLAPPGTSIDHVVEHSVRVGLSYRF
jgi:outer membrane immunogenic protein